MSGRLVRRYSDIALAALVVGIVGMMIIPLPTHVLDILLATNISLAVIVLLAAIYVTDPIRISTFPTLLLITTLFRLGLNVSSTRLILLQADAGEVIRSFGHFVVAGNLVVGIIVFLILTLIQFVVIAKGAERVAEVSARFCLDGMPGKQMSIDADLRAGVIDQQQAGRRRTELERESQFYGAMDGAMKFVKGDAVAGIIITLVNITGGLLVGTLQQGLEAGEAVTRYTVLTIGDGLVSQIPALLVSTAAGLVVTRVRGGDGPRQLGRQVLGEISAHPQVALMAGAVLGLLALVPGMPTLAFGLLAVGLVVLGVRLAGRLETAEKQQSQDGAEREIILEIDGAGRVSLDDERLEQMRREIERRLGVAVPPIRLVQGGRRGRWTLWLDGIPRAGGEVAAADLDEQVLQALLRVAPQLLGVQEAQDMLDRLERQQPALVREVVPRLVPPVLLAEILSRLLEEQVSVHNLRGILVALAEWARVEADPAALAERVRASLAPLITHQVAPEGRLEALLLDPGLEGVIEQGLQRSESGTTLALEPDHAQAIVAAVTGAVAGQQPEAVVLTRPDIRRPLWRLVSQVLPRLRVVSFLELDARTEIVPRGRIALPAPGGGGS